jgi:hypothetical protein
LFHRQQVERALADAAASEPARVAHEELAQRYEAQINEMTAETFLLRRTKPRRG